MPRKQEIDLEDEDPPSIEPYSVLGIEKTATADEVKWAYRKAALKHHPGMRFTFQSSTYNQKYSRIVQGEAS
jgi:DnaJ family protein C protein 9